MKEFPIKTKWLPIEGLAKKLNRDVLEIAIAAQENSVEMRACTYDEINGLGCETEEEENALMPVELERDKGAYENLKKLKAAFNSEGVAESIGTCVYYTLVRYGKRMVRSGLIHIEVDAGDFKSKVSLPRKIAKTREHLHVRLIKEFYDELYRDNENVHIPTDEVINILEAERHDPEDAETILDLEIEEIEEADDPLERVFSLALIDRRGEKPKYKKKDIKAKRVGDIIRERKKELKELFPG